MELKPGYKQTEVGVIPEDWDIKNIGNISEVKTGPFGTALHEKDYVDNGTPIITVEHLGEYGVDHSNLPMVSDEDKKRLKSYTLKVGDIAFSRVGSIDRNALIRKKEDGWLFSGRLLRVRVNNEKYDSGYLSYYFHSESFKQRIRGVAVGQTMPSLNTAILKGVKVVLPEMVEQTTIANALSDADALIQSLTRLIAKKRQIKQGAMQTLLNPYENGLLKEGWVVKTIEDMCISEGLVRGPFGGALKKECFIASGYKVYEQRNAIYRDIGIGSYFIDQKKYQELKRFSVKPGDFVISCSGTIGRIYQIPVGAPPGVINQALLKLTIDNEKFSEEYFYHYFSWSLFQERIIDSTQGGAMKNLVGMPIFKVTEMPIPEKLHEQTRIATILSGMDAEIAALEAKLAKYRHIKQGMMQNLLTGRIRLVKPESNTGAVA